MTALLQLALQIMCARCHATPGVHCRTNTGRRATWLHASRTHPVYEAYGQGYTDADNDHKRGE